ncbi:MAG: DUF87 domain-containing protein, partial [Patescibacteria group bacterium]
MDPIYYQIFLDRLITISLAGLAAILAAGLTFILIYLVIIYFRLKKREEISLEMITLEVKLSKENEIKIDAADQMFSSFSSLKKSGFFSFLEVDDVISFEIIGKKAEIRFYVSAPNRIIDLIEKTIYGYYPMADIKKVDEPNIFSERGKVVFGGLVQKEAPYMPIRIYRDLPTDSLSAITSTLSKFNDNEAGIIQILIRPAGSKWKKQGKSYVSSTKKNEANPEKATFKTDPKVLEKIDDKCSKPGFETTIRFVVTAPSKDMAETHLKNIKNSFTQLNSDTNNFTGTKIYFKGGFMINFIYKFFPIIDFSLTKSISILSTDELATLFHFPNKTVETPHIQWLKAKTAPVPIEVLQTGGTALGDGYYRGVKRPVNIGVEDRRRHIYIIGKTGVGKSVLLHDMAIQDIKAGNGVCVIDPHGDLIDDIVKYIPPERAEDVIYFDPSDVERPMGLNLLEAKTEDQKHFITTS